MPSGMAGLGILIFMALLGSAGQLLVPYPDATEHWRDIEYWQDNAQAAPPVWTNGPWNGGIAAASQVVQGRAVAAGQGGAPAEAGAPAAGGGAAAWPRRASWEFAYDFQADRAPRDLIVAFNGSGRLPVVATMVRPDGRSLELFRAQLELTPGQRQRFSLAYGGVARAIDFVRGVDAAQAGAIDPLTAKAVELCLAAAGPDMAAAPRMLKGRYLVRLDALLVGPDSALSAPELRVSGSVSGWLGTDKSKRDIFTGIVLGVRWALLIGILAAALTVLVGVLLGVAAALFGGWVDWLLNRIYEFFYLMPVLPFMIVVSALYRPSIWTLVAIIVVFFWTGSFKPIYSMALQLREATFVEAALALGASRWRVVLRHVFPIVLPYSFASIALSIPGVVIYEATVSLLGLGDSTIVTWGQILQDAYGQSAVVGNLWWWVVSPGLMIALMGVAFVFLGRALDRILHPKLRTR